MADEAPKTNGNGEPPKIKLDLGNGTARPKTGPRDDDAGAPPRIRIQPTAKKTETTRIDLAQAQPPPAAKGETQQVLPEAAEAGKRSTVRVDVPLAAKAETQRVKAETKRVDASTISKQTTVRVEGDEKRKTETTRISLPADSFRKAAPKIDVGEVAAGESEDVFKRRTIPVGIPTPPPAAAAKPKTIQVKKPAMRPGEPSLAATPPAEETVSEAKKSETARIDLPPDVGERPATRPKTIRIKRPDGTTARKALTIARPSEEEAPVALGAAVGAEAGEEEPGTVYSVLALVALLVTCVLLYVLAAQSFAPDLPFPGRL